jgi:hypothetical protein
MAPDDQTVAVLELPCERGDPDWERSDSDLKAEARDLLGSQNLIDPQQTDIVAFDSHAVPFAYPILEVGTRTKADRLRAYLDRFDNLHRLGRSADFTYTHVHSLFARARKLTATLAERDAPARVG